MARKKLHKVGERFVMYKLIYEVREGSSCKDCSLFIEEENCCSDMYKYNFEFCTRLFRDDGKDVVFILVGEVQE